MSDLIEQTTTTDARHAAEAELTTLVNTVRGLGTQDLARPTDCVGWTVRDIVAHLTGAAEEAVHPTVMVRHLVKARTTLRRLPLADALTQVQVADRAGRADADVARELAALAPRVAHARARMPAVIRHRRLPDPAVQRGDDLGYLLDVIYTRDVWMHRIDISRATALPMPHSDGENVVVEQIVRDLQRGWPGPAFILELTGRVRGRWAIGQAPGLATATITEDSVSLCRLLAGRSDETRLGSDAPGSARAQLRQYRILF